MSSLAIQPPALVFEEGDNDAPYEYTVPGAGAIEPTASTATFDGTDAAGPFLAALFYRSQSGQVISRVFPTTPVQAGDVAQVSYAPFPGGLIETSKAGGFPLPTAVAAYEASLTVPARSGGNITWNGGLAFGTELFSYGAGDDSPAALATGFYSITCSASMLGNASATGFIQGILFWNDPVILTGLIANSQMPLLLDAVTLPFEIESSATGAWSILAGQSGSLFYGNTSTHDMDVNVTIEIQFWAES